MADESSNRKKRKLENSSSSIPSTSDIHRSLERPISPPPLRNTNVITKRIRSPFQLTNIADLPSVLNIDTVSLKDILGDPMIAECWNFNYLHDVDFLMKAFDEDVRDIVNVHIVHGFWKQEDQLRLALTEQAEKYKNVSLHTAYMSEMFGTHHSKMLIVIRHDDLAQVIIHTANMIPFDWENMTQGLWRSPLLPKQATKASSSSDAIGSGSRFKTDLLNYLRAYDTRRMICKPLIEELLSYDFSNIKAALVASVPGRHKLNTAPGTTQWGWPGLKKVLACVPTISCKPEIVIQVSSIATLGPNDKWLHETFFKTLNTSQGNTTSSPNHHIIFPTADEIRRSLKGYRSGSAVHTKIQSAAQQKQLSYLRPFFRHWAGDSNPSEPNARRREAGRKRAAPHIKTYIRFLDKEKTEVDWMLVTSANLSKQAWGDVITPAGDVRVCSFEIGVLVWPGLIGGEGAKMVPTFGSDEPGLERRGGESMNTETVVGARMPYSLPLIPYAKDENPWCANMSYNEPDWQGVTYQVHREG